MTDPDDAWLAFIFEPTTWSTPMRRAFLLTLPISGPLWIVTASLVFVGIAIVTASLALAGIAIGYLLWHPCNWAYEFWLGEEEVQRRELARRFSQPIDTPDLRSQGE